MNNASSNNNSEKEIKDALETMIYTWDTFGNYMSSKADWQHHYQATTTLLAVYQRNINELLKDETTPDFLQNLRRHIEKLEMYRDYGLLVKP